jgi:lipopolysaccharide export system permease protein
MSIIFFIQISRVTSFIEITFLELGKLYTFMLPQIFLFTIPISFFIAISLSFFRLSKENETIVLFTLGYSPRKIALFFTTFAAVITILLLITSLVFIPLSRELNQNFIDYKKAEAAINIKATEFGQKFANWMVFVEKEVKEDDNRAYENLIMYSKTPERLIISEKAAIVNEQGELKLSLFNGRAYEVVGGTLHEVLFKNMLFFSYPSDSIKSIDSILDFWKDIKSDHKKAKNFSLYVLISLFPLATLFFALSYGIVTYRYQKGGIYGVIFSVLFFYFASIMLIGKTIPLSGIAIVFLLFFITSILFFRQKILKRF